MIVEIAISVIVLMFLYLIIVIIQNERRYNKLLTEIKQTQNRN